MKRVYKLQLIIHWLAWVLAGELENLLLKDLKAAEGCWGVGEVLGPVAGPQPVPRTTSGCSWLGQRIFRPQRSGPVKQRLRAAPVSAALEYAFLSRDTGPQMSNTPSQLRLLALGSWGAESTFQAHQKCLRYFSSGSADCCGCQVSDGMNFGCKSNI